MSPQTSPAPELNERQIIDCDDLWKIYALVLNVEAGWAWRKEWLWVLKMQACFARFHFASATVSAYCAAQSTMDNITIECEFKLLNGQKKENFPCG